MRWAYQVKDKMKVVAVLMLIIILILANNMVNRKTFSNLNQSIASIYKDRLMPATYIFQLTDHLYQKRLLNDDDVQSNTLPTNLQQHDAAIKKIISTYETTYITKSEKEQWAAFKSGLQQYNALSKAPVKDKTAMNNSFNKVLQSLNALSELQASEGNALFKTSSININGTVITSQLEIALLIILGVIALILISANDNNLTRIQRSELN
ncbi:MAG: MCP four helix bundle domain-containing protein [Bacteroidetes bacterium]|nr:MCP four helix bundle domain-containing protein [Bacteroidota bacterium]